MNVWKLNAAKSLVKTEEPTPEPEAGKYKVRITKLLVNGVDAAIYRGETKVKYPLVPGRYAVGIIADEGDASLYPKGTRVLLHTYVPAPDTGTAKKDFSEDEVLVCGRTRNGFLRDFVFVGKDEMTPLPDSVSDESALLLHHIALAKSAVDALDAQKGEHVAVVGADLLGNLICQLLIYEQASPILIDAYPERLEFARAGGVYYTLLQDETLLGNVAEITGGRLAGGAVFVTSARGNETSLPFTVCAREKRIVLCGCETAGLNMNLEALLTKELSVFGVHDGRDCLENAINLIVSGAIDLSAYRANVSSAEVSAKALENISSEPDQDVGELHIISLI